MGFMARARRAISGGDKESEERRRRESIARNDPTRLSLDEIKEFMPGTEAANMSLKRMEAYNERPVQRLLKDLLDEGPNAEIMPEYDPSYGFRYTHIEALVKKDADPEDAIALLERLSSLAILRKTFYDTVSVCPNCASTLVTMHYRCPKCDAGHVVKTGLMEHIPCGNIDERDKFYQGHTEPTCPKCGAKLVEGQYRDMGVWYVCRNCQERFEHPNLDLTCRNCGNQFNIPTSIVHEVSKYSINPDREKEIRQNVTSLESIEQLLTQTGFYVEPLAVALGQKSGIQHYFSLIAKKTFEDREINVVVDHAIDDIEVGPSPLILYTYKISEVKTDIPLFVAIPRLSETARKIARGYNIMVVEGMPTRKEQLNQLQRQIQTRIEQILAEKPAAKEEEIVLHEHTLNLRGRTIEVLRDETGRFRSAKVET